MGKSLRWRSDKQLFLGKSCFDNIESRDQITVGADQNSAVKAIFIRIGDDACGNMNISLLFFVLGPLGATQTAPLLLLLKMTQDALHPDKLECLYVFNVPLIGARTPCGVRGKIVYFDHRLGVASQRSGERPQVEPFENGSI